MEQIEALSSLREVVAAWRQQGHRIGFVPTMGNLHRGHLRLVEVAQQHADKVVVSVFVNPMQFGPNEDFARYPRTLNEDAAVLGQHGVDVLFAPATKTVYSQELTVTTCIDVPALANILEGEYRPGFFRGVATVVTKLFNMVQPDLAIFGEKDFQQLLVVRRMVAELNFPIEIVGVTTDREPDGLAMSSRNQYLDATQRKIAPTLYQTLSDIRVSLKNSKSDVEELERTGRGQLEKLGFAVDYLTIRDAATLLHPNTHTESLVILVAARLGSTRLIDNLRV